MVSHSETGCRQIGASFATFCARGSYRLPPMMDPMFDIPKDRKRLNVGKLCVLLGMTVLLYILVAQQFSQAAQVLVPSVAR